MTLLRQLKDFDAERAQMLAARALQDQEREKLRVSMQNMFLKTYACLLR